MIRIQDIADMVGVSRTTVSNVIHGNTKRVSKQTMDKITAILDEQGYVPNMGSMILTSNVSRIIGFVLGYDEIHGYNAMQDPFVGKFVGTLLAAADEAGYYVMLIKGRDIDNIVNIASRWNIDGLVALGFTEQNYYVLKKKLNKPVVLIDTYAKEQPEYINIGIDDYSGGYQIGEYLLEQGFPNALFIAETQADSDFNRWLGFQAAMKVHDIPCDLSRYIVVSMDADARMHKYKKMLSKFLAAGALAFSSDYSAMEAINFFADQKICVPEDLSVTGFDDNMYTTMIRPRLTTVRQDVGKKAEVALEQLVKLIHDETVMEYDIRIPVELVIRESVKKNNK